MSLDDAKRRTLQERLELLLEQYNNVNRQHDQTLNEAEKPALKRRIATLEQDITEVEAELKALTSASDTPRRLDDGKLSLFISYARKDGLKFCEQLYSQLETNGFHVWRDKRDLNPYTGFDAEIEQAIEKATTLIVIATADVKREDSFVRLEIAYGLTHKKQIIPLLFPQGHRPITIFNHTYIDFSDWDQGYAALLERLNTDEIDDMATIETAVDSSPDLKPDNRREMERSYLEKLGQDYEIWLYLYTDLGGRAEKPETQPRVKVKTHVKKYLNTANSVYRERGYIEEGETRQVETVNELREVVRQGGVILIGEPGSGKTTTLQRLAYEFAVAAIDDEDAPLPIFVPLGAYEGQGLENHIGDYFGGLPLADYLPKRVVLLLDGLNEMPAQYMPDVDAWVRKNANVLTVVTCRRLDYAALQALPLRRVDVSPLDVNRILLFIGNYLEDDDRDRIFWALAGEDAADMWRLFQKHNQTFADFWNGNNLDKGHPVYSSTSGNQDKTYNTMRTTLHERGDLPHLLGLVTNPFLLKITVDVFIESGKPPRNRGQLFSAFVNLLIEQRGYPAVTEDHPWIAPEIQIQALAGLAYQMQQENTGTTVGVDWALAALAHNGVDDPANLLYLAESATLLTVDRTQNEFKFFHQLLQEYFAACQMVKDIEAGVPASNYWSADWWQPTGWEETVVLAAGMHADAAKWLLETHPILACRARTEGISAFDILPDVRKQLVEAMIGDAPPKPRAEIGRIINRISDPRPGVGIDAANRLPDIYKTWCAVPAGTYPIGGDDEAYNSLPAGAHILKYDFRIAKYPVTNAQFQAFIDSDKDGYNNPAYWTQRGLGWKGDRQAPDEYGDMDFRLPNHPRIFVRWYEAMAFCAWLTEKYQETGIIGQDMRIRLPQEKEWEIAARGGDKLYYPYGNEFYATKANVRETGIGQTSAVGLFADGISWCAALDMSGNVWEWCLNVYNNPDSFEESVTDDTNASRVLRGGSFVNSLYDARCACRDFYGYPDNIYGYLGFRVVLCPIAL